MKKIFILLFITLFTFSLVSCSEIDVNTKNNQTETKEGNDKDEELLTFINNLGEEVVIKNSMDFYEVYETLCLTNIRDFASKSGKQLTLNGKIKIGNKTNLCLNGDLYFPNQETFFYDLEANYEGSKDILIYQDYYMDNGASASKKDTKLYQLYSYKNEVAMSGREEKGYQTVSYSGPNIIYPLDPSSFYDIWYIAYRLSEMFDNYYAFSKYNQLDNTYIDGEKYQFDTYAERNFTISNDCIILEQTAPFLSAIQEMTEADMHEFSYYVRQSIATNKTITQKLVYNVKTNCIEEFSVKGNSFTLLTTPQMDEYTIDLTVKFIDLNQSEFDTKTNELFKYVQSNCIRQG
jgi:hypothetical protein